MGMMEKMPPANDLGTGGLIGPPIKVKPIQPPPIAIEPPTPGPGKIYGQRPDRKGPMLGRTRSGVISSPMSGMSSHYNKIKW